VTNNEKYNKLSAWILARNSTQHTNNCNVLFPVITPQNLDTLHLAKTFQTFLCEMESLFPSRRRTSVAFPNLAIPLVNKTIVILQ